MNPQSSGRLGKQRPREYQDKASKKGSPYSISPDAAVTPVLIAFNLAVYFGMLVDGLPLQGPPSIERLMAWGANFGPLTLSGEWWRLIACVFVHESLFHALPNLVALWLGGSLLERHAGSANFLAIYLVSALGSSLASLAWSPGSVAYGASGAVLGVLGALAVLSFRKLPFIEPQPMIAPFTMAVMILLATGLLGLLSTNVDNAGHLGGLLAGSALAWALRSFSSPQSTKGSTFSALIAAGTCLLVLGLAAANLPKHIIVIEAEFQRFHAVQKHLINQISLAQEDGVENQVDLVGFRDLLAEKILPLSRSARERIEVLEQIPPAYERHREMIVMESREREISWQSYIEQATRLENLLFRISGLEEEIASSYARIQNLANEGSLSRQKAAERLFESTVDPWNPLIVEMEDDEELYEGLRERLGTLRTYAVLRERAWELSAQSVRENAPELAIAAQEEHRRANEEMAAWIE